MLIQSLGPEHGLKTVRFGLSAVRPESELVYGRSDSKEPDLLVFSLADLTDEEIATLAAEDLEAADRTKFLPNQQLHFAFHKALAGIEVEFSPYRATEMKDRYWKVRSEEQWTKRPLKRSEPPTAPNVIVKEEDLPRLLQWENATGVPIVVVHVFDQEAFAVLLKTLADFNEIFERQPEVRLKLQMTTGIFKKIQSYNRVDAQGAGEKKMIFRVPPCSAVKVGDLSGVTVSAQLGVSSSKKYVTHAIFSGGEIKLDPSFLQFLCMVRDSSR